MTKTILRLLVFYAGLLCDDEELIINDMDQDNGIQIGSVAVILYNGTNLPETIETFTKSDMKLYENLFAINTNADPPLVMIFSSAETAETYLTSENKNQDISPVLERDLTDLSVQSLISLLESNNITRTKSKQNVYSRPKKQQPRGSAKKRDKRGDPLDNLKKRRKERRRKRREAEQHRKKFKPHIRLGENMGINIPIWVFYALGAVSVLLVVYSVKVLADMKKKRKLQLERKKAQMDKKALRKLEKNKKRLKKLS